MNRWPLRPLAALATDARGSITDGPFGSHLTSAHYTETGPQVVRLQNIGDGVYRRAEAHISEEHFETLRKHEVLPGDLLLASLGEVLPRACLMPDDIGPAIVKADCIRIRLRDDVDARWVMYSMQRPVIRKWADDLLHGVGRPRLGLGVIRRIPVPLPALDEQRRIVDILEDHLSRLDAADASLRGARHNAGRLRSMALARVWRDGLRQGRLQTIDSIAAGGLFVDGDWVESKDQDPAGTVRLTQLADVGIGEFRDRSDRWMREDQASRLHCTFLLPRDVLIARMPDPLGRACLAPNSIGRAVTAVDVAILRPHDDSLLPEFVMLLLNSPQAHDRMTALQSGTTRKRISRKNLGSIRVPIPSIEAQQGAIDSYRTIEDSLATLQAALDTLAARSTSLRRALLTAAFSGRLTGRSSDLDIAEELMPT